MLEVSFGNMLKLKPFFCCLLISAANAALSDDCRTIQFRQETKNKFLENHMIRSMTVSGKSPCESQCYQEPNCVSYNYGPMHSDTPSCDLNNRTHLQASSGDFVLKDDYTYRDISNPCESNPCPVSSTCQVGFTSKGYRCISPPGNDEEQPELAWTTGPSGFSYQRIDDPQTWSNAQAKCVQLGAHLPKIESAAENDFIKTTFLNGDHIWIGLSDQVNEGDWKWFDGSPFTGYQNWGNGNPNNYNNQDCALMQTGLSWGFQYDGHWNDVSCYEMYKFICVK